MVVLEAKRAFLTKRFGSDDSAKQGSLWSVAESEGDEEQAALKPEVGQCTWRIPTEVVSHEKPQIILRTDAKFAHVYQPARLTCRKSAVVRVSGIDISASFCVRDDGTSLS